MHCDLGLMYCDIRQLKKTTAGLMRGSMVGSSLVGSSTLFLFVFMHEYYKMLVIMHVD